MAICSALAVAILAALVLLGATVLTALLLWPSGGGVWS